MILVKFALLNFFTNLETFGYQTVDRINSKLEICLAKDKATRGLQKKSRKCLRKRISEVYRIPGAKILNQETRIRERKLHELLK